MKLKAQKFTHDHVALSFEAENQAIRRRLAATTVRQPEDNGRDEPRP